MHLDALTTFKYSRSIFDALLKQDKRARFVGGCVRDVLLNREVTDVDIGTALHPDEIEKIFNHSKRIKIKCIGKDYGTIIIIIRDHIYEITTLRKDVHTDGRYAVVEYTDDWEEDASRRDLTINAMSYSPIENKLYDYFNGQNDLEAGLIKFIGDPNKRVKEDYLRILRLFRFYTYYGKTIDPPSLVACAKHAENICRLSKERKMKELYRIISHERYIGTLVLMAKHGILEYISTLPDWHSGIKLCKQLDKVCPLHGQESSAILKIFTLFQGDNLAPSRITKEFITLSKKDKDYIIKLSRFVNSTTLNNVINKPYHSLYYHREALIDGILYLMAKRPRKVDLNRIINMLKYEIPIFPVTGDELMLAIGLRPGKKLGKAIEVAKDFWIASKFKATKKDVIDHMKLSKDF